jgi:hypothetical protein
MRTSLLLALCLLASTTAAHAESQRPAVPPPTVRDGQRDFDFLIGKWSVTLRRLKNPLTGSTEWIEGKGQSSARHLFGGKANMDEFEMDMPSGRISAVTIRLYNPETHQWFIYWANAANAKIDIPTIGEFKDGVGTFYDHELIKGRAVLVRYVWSKITPKSAHFEQAFSVDGGKTWEVNWITDQTRIE